MTEDTCICDKPEMRKACLKYDECLVTGKLRNLLQKQSDEVDKKSDSHLLSMLNYEVSLLQRRIGELESKMVSMKMELNRINPRTA